MARTQFLRGSLTSATTISRVNAEADIPYLATLSLSLVIVGLKPQRLAQCVQHAAASQVLLSYLFVVGRAEVFCEVVASVVLTWSKEKSELVLDLAVPKPPVLHVARFCLFWLEVSCCKSQRGSVVCLGWSGGLLVSHFHEHCAGGYCLS